MYINSKSLGPIRPETATQTKDIANRDSGASSNAPAASPVTRSDKVEISDAGRALAARDGSQSGDVNASRTDRIRGRILSGAYDTLEVVDTVARRLLDSSDL